MGHVKCDLEHVLYCATSNADKLREFRLALGDLLQIQQLGGFAPPEETGATFAENAILKALYYSRFCDGPVFVDDSGIEVDALAGDPGVHSARYAGPNATDEDNNRLLLARMSGMANRAARFVCVIALARGGQLIRIFRGTVEGQVVESARGDQGFGYDPLFFYLPFGCTFGEVERERKTTISHRGQALKEMAHYLNKVRGACWPAAVQT